MPLELLLRPIERVSDPIGQYSCYHQVCTGKRLCGNPEAYVHRFVLPRAKPTVCFESGCSRQAKCLGILAVYLDYEVLLVVRQFDVSFTDYDRAHAEKTA